MSYIVVEWSGGGGLAHYSFLMADALARRGLDVVLATRREHELDALPHRMRIARLWPRAPRLTGRLRRAVIAGGWFLGWLRLLLLVLREKRRTGEVVVHPQAPESVPELLFLALLRIMATRLVITAHNALPHDHAGRGTLLHRVTYRIPHAIVSQGNADAELVRGLAGRRPRITVVPHGTYAPIADAFPQEPARDGAFRVVHLGNIRPYKGFDTVVAAVGRAMAADPTLTFHAMGPPANADEVRALLETLPAGRWSADLKYATIEEVVREARRADALLLGHRRASESGILHLALGAGTPVVGPNLAGIGRLLAARPSWRYAPGDADAAAEALLRVGEETRAGRAALRAAAREIEDSSAPSWEAVADAHIALLEEMRGARR